MSLFAGLDISVKTTAICVLDANGRVLLETMVDSAPEAIAGRLHEFGQPFERTRINKTDRNDARGIAQMMRVGLFKAVHVKTPASQHRRLLLTSRKLLQRKIYDIENDLRGSLRNFGLKVGVVGKIKFEDRIRELVADHSFVAAIVAPLLEARAALRAQFAKLHRMLLDLVQVDPVCRRLMSAPGVGPIVALTFRTCVDNPARFSRSKCVGAHYGLTPRIYQSGEISRTGRISRSGDVMLRSSLYEAALVVLTGPGRGTRSRPGALQWRAGAECKRRWSQLHASSRSYFTGCGGTIPTSAGAQLQPSHRGNPHRFNFLHAGGGVPRGRRDWVRPRKLVRRTYDRAA